MSALGRGWRSVVALVVGVLVVAGTVLGSDDLFPFAPMRQYAYAVDPDGGVSTHFVEGIGPDGEPVRIAYDAIDMRPAELEGILRPVGTRTERLAEVLATFRSRHPDAPPTVGIRYVRRRVQLVDRRPGPPELIELERYVAPAGVTPEASAP
jgi:hypothetical protein